MGAIGCSCVAPRLPRLDTMSVPNRLHRLYPERYSVCQKAKRRSSVGNRPSLRSCRKALIDSTGAVVYSRMAAAICGSGVGGDVELVAMRHSRHAAGVAEHFADDLSRRRQWHADSLPRFGHEAALGMYGRCGRTPAGATGYGGLGGAVKFRGRIDCVI